MSRYLSLVLTRLARLLVFMVGATLVLLVLALGLTLGAVVLLWNLVTGRRSQWRFQAMNPQHMGRWADMVRGARAKRSDDGDVVDVEARELPESDSAPSDKRLP
jgi:hypothetical protein